VLLSVAFYLLAEPLAGLFDGGDGVVLLLQLLSTTFFITSLRNPWIVGVYHRLEYRKMAVIESLGGLGGNVLAIGLLWWTEHPAALAAGVIITHLVGSVTTWVYAERRPSLTLDFSELATVWKFARFLLINNIVIFLLTQLDDVFIAKIAGLELLGLYALAYKVANDSVLFLISTLRQILLPAFVRLKDNSEAFANAALRSVGTLSAVSWVLSTAVFVASNELMLLISPGSEWRGSEIFLMALMPFVLIRSVNGVFGSLIIAMGRPQVLSIVAGAQLVALIPLMWLGYEVGLQWGGEPLHGVLGLTLAITVLNYAANIGVMAYAHRYFAVSFWRASGLMWLLAPVSVGAAWLGLWVKSDANPAWLNLLISMVTVTAVISLAWQLLARIPGIGVLMDSPLSLLDRVRKKKA
jgi:O-antigen/teichoic acid export membrane protein